MGQAPAKEKVSATMAFNHAWQSVFRPRASDDFFAADRPVGFQAGAQGFSPVNAWWLQLRRKWAWICRKRSPKACSSCSNRARFTGMSSPCAMIPNPNAPFSLASPGAGTGRFPILRRSPGPRRKSSKQSEKSGTASRRGCSTLRKIPSTSRH